MRKIIVIARREYVSMVGSKAFIIGVAALPILMVVGGFLPRLLEKSVDLGDKKIVVLDRSGALFDPLSAAADKRNNTQITDPKTGQQTGARYILERTPADSVSDEMRLTLSNRVRNREIYAFVEIPDAADGSAGIPAYYAESSALSDTKQWLERTLNEIVRKNRFQTSGVDPEIVRLASVPVPLEGRGLFIREKNGQVLAAEPINQMAAIFLPMGIMMLMFMIVYISFLPMLEVVFEEKQNRIAEVLLGSVNAMQLMTGKLLGSVAGSLTTVSLYLAAGAGIAKYNNVLDQVPWGVMPWFIAFQILAVLMYSALVMALSAAATNLQEAQGYLIIVLIPLMFPMFVWFNIVREPNGSFATWSSFFVPATPMLMVLRMAATSVPVWQPLLGIVLVLLLTVVAVFAASRVFRIGMLAQGNAPKLSQLVRWIVTG